MTGWDYGNARVAALRSRLLDGAALRRLGDAESPAALLSLLAAFEDWRPFLAPAPGLRPAWILDAAIERHRSARLSALLRWYEPPARHLVEAVVMPLDLQRVLSMLRLRRSRQAPGPVASGDATAPRPGTAPGALLDAGRLALLSRTAGEGGPFRQLARLDLIGRRDAALLAGDADRGAPPEALEASLHEAWERARDARARGAGDDGQLVRDEIRRERRDRRAVRDVLRVAGVEDAATLERHLALDRMARLERRARREPLGAAPVVGYHAALEHQALQLRAAMARPGAAWDVDRTASFTAVG